MIPSFLLTDTQIRNMEELRLRDVARRLPLAVPWTDDIKWAPELTIQTKTFPKFRLFDVKPLRFQDINSATMSQVVQSPGRHFVYAEKVLPKGHTLPTVCGRRRGTVMFDRDILIPCLHEVATFGSGWCRNPWMSITPMEMMTLRPGTKRAKGRVIVAGLGLGHQLIQVSKRTQVQEIVLVEKSRELVDWLLPRIKTHLARPIDDVVIGDAYKVLRKMVADVALIDIFPSHGSNSFTEWVPVSPTVSARREQPIPTPGIKSIWCWGGRTGS